MNAFNIFICAAFILVTCRGETTPTEQNLLAVDAPEFFPDQPSPLLKAEESLQKKEYFDFLSTLYRHDKTKAGLFQAKTAPASASIGRRKRAVYFRPLFVYRQQQVKRQKESERRRRRY